MKFTHLLLLLALCTLAFDASAKLNKTQCESKDWFAVGSKDARKNRRNRVLDFEEQCRRHGVTIDSAAYVEGYQTRLDSLCSADRGYQRGMNGKELNGACAKVDDFQDAWADGRDVARKRRQAREQLNRIDERLAEDEEHIRVLRELLMRPGPEGELPDPVLAASVDRLIFRLQLETQTLENRRVAFESYLQKLRDTRYRGQLPPPPSLVMLR